jgi:UDP-glucose 4-epimerase
MGIGRELLPGRNRPSFEASTMRADQWVPVLTVLVTGGAGYIGGHMVLGLRDAGRDVVVVDDLSTGFAWALPPSVPFYQGDCGDQELVAKIIRHHGIRAVVHFAGSIVVPESVTNPLGYYLNNTVHSRALLAAVVAEGVREFIFSSTAAVYGNPADTPVSEDAALKPISPYGTSKMMTEIMLRDASHAHDLRFVALRYFNVAGADPKQRWGQSSERATHLIKIASQVVTGARESMDVFGDDYPTKDGTCIRDYIHVSDLIEAHVLALGHLNAGGESLVLNCGYGQGYSVLEVVDAVRKVSGRDLPIRIAPRRPGDPPELVAAADRIRAALDWKPAWNNLQAIVEHAVAWEAKLKKIKEPVA